MIRTNVRSLRALSKMLQPNEFKNLMIGFRDRIGYDFARCVVIENPSLLLIFNSTLNCGTDKFPYDKVYSYFPANVCEKLYHSNNRRLLAIPLSDLHLLEYGYLFKELVLLPDTIDEDFSFFLKTNEKALEPIRNKYGRVDATDYTAKSIYVKTNGSKSLFIWAESIFLQYAANLTDINNIITWCDLYPQLIKKLEKGTVTAYTSPNGITNLIREMREIARNKKASDTINMFNTKQKKMLKEEQLPPSILDALSKFSKLSSTKKFNFIRKVSSIDNKEELFRELKLISSIHFDWNRESFIDYLENVEGLSYEVKMDENGVILLKVNDYETIKKLGKTTSWCISKNKTYWKNYANGKSSQFMLFDFNQKEDDKLSIIGITASKGKGITASHNFRNDNLIKSDDLESERMRSLHSAIFRFFDNSDIHTILSKYGISEDNLFENNLFPYKWEKTSVLATFFKHVNAENATVLLDNGEKLVISVCDPNFRSFIGETFNDAFDEYEKDDEFILFCDFTKSQTNSDRLKYAMIRTDFEVNESVCVKIANINGKISDGSNFDKLIASYGLPYDVISRKCDSANSLAEMLRNYEGYQNNSIVISKKTIKKAISKLEKDEVNFAGILESSILNYYSFEYLTLIYSNGLTLSEIYEDKAYIYQLVNNIISSIQHFSGNDDTIPVLGLDRTIALYNSNRLTDINAVKAITLYLALKMILKNEFDRTADAFSKNILEHIVKTLYTRTDSLMLKQIAQDLLEITSKQVEYSSITSSLTNYWSRYKYAKSGAEIKEKVTAAYSF